MWRLGLWAGLGLSQKLVELSSAQLTENGDYLITEDGYNILHES